MKKTSAVLTVILMFAVLLSGCQSADNVTTNSNEAIVSEQTDNVVANEDKVVSTSTEAQEPVSTSEETFPVIKYYTPTKYGTGLEFNYTPLHNCLDDSDLHLKINYGFNRLLYGIGVYAGCYEVENNFMAPEFVNYTSDKLSEDLIRLTFYFNVYTADKEDLSLSVEADLECDSAGCYGGEPLSTNFVVEISNHPYSYDTFDMIDFYERVPGSIDVERRFNIDDGTVVEILDPDDIVSAPDNDTTTAIPSSNVMSDSALEYQANICLHQIAREIESEYRNNGYNTFTASPHIAYTSITDQTDSTVTVQGRIDYWFAGGNPDGNLTAYLVLDRLNGSLINYNLN